MCGFNGDRKSRTGSTVQALSSFSKEGTTHTGKLWQRVKMSNKEHFFFLFRSPPPHSWQNWIFLGQEKKFKMQAEQLVKQARNGGQNPWICIGRQFDLIRVFGVLQLGFERFVLVEKFRKRCLKWSEVQKADKHPNVTQGQLREFAAFKPQLNMASSPND